MERKNNLLNLIRKHALKNAIEHDGKALVNPVVAGVLGERPEFKGRISEILKKVEEIVKKVNEIPLEEQRNQLKKNSSRVFRS